MEKSELERKLESAEFYTKSLEYKIEILEPKAEAYDRLMSGKQKTLNEIANFLGCVITVDRFHTCESFNRIPKMSKSGFWYCDEDDENFDDEHFIIPSDCVYFNGDWKDSLTLPDGWEEKHVGQ